MSTYVNYAHLLADGNVVLLDDSADAISLFSQAGLLVPHINLMQFFTFLYAVLLSKATRVATGCAAGKISQYVYVNALCLPIHLPIIQCLLVVYIKINLKPLGMVHCA